ncbi:hypothetical protein ABT119_06060 [Streptomyces sp. NPDC001910]|uniref:hypothetical protein n=1 Tax=Streptomyces sp. NPDC001910 TaxID=3154403 RepID=UPI003325393F
MGYAYYEITRPNGDRIAAGYSVEAVCEAKGCTAKIDRGLAYLCGKDPRGDEHGCSGYFCEQHLYGDNQCETCSAKADAANLWVHPMTGEEFDLRDRFIRAGSRYDTRGIVWRYAGHQCAGIPVLEPVYAHSQRTAHGELRLITDGEWENAATVMYRQMGEQTAKVPH